MTGGVISLDAIIFFFLFGYYLILYSLNIIKVVPLFVTLQVVVTSSLTSLLRTLSKLRNEMVITVKVINKSTLNINVYFRLQLLVYILF
jgi:hypothetical protein